MMNEQTNPMKDYLWNTGNIAASMRLIVEGAVTLYDDEASPLHKMALTQGLPAAASAFEIIGTACLNSGRISFNCRSRTGR